MNNFSTFAYDGLSRNVSIVETIAGIVTSTKQFVWCSDKKRIYQPCEERDASGMLTKQYFRCGQINNPAKYFYSNDQLGTVRELTDSGGAIKAEYIYDPFGLAQTIQQTVASDIGFTGLYIHTRSAFNLAVFRDYKAIIGRWISRDPISEEGGTNLFSYANNNPISRSDVMGLKCDDWGSWGAGGPGFGNWGGQGRTNGSYAQNEIQNFPGSGAVGSQTSPFNPPCDPLDACAYWHDVCLNVAARIQSPKGRRCMRRDCDKHLAICASNIFGDPRAPFVAGVFGGTWSPNNNTGDDPGLPNSGWHPELGPDPLK